MARAGDHVQVLVNGHDLTGDHNRITVNDSYQMLEATTFGMNAQRFIAGQRQMSLQHVGYLNPDSTAAHPVLNTVSVEGVVSVLLGENTTPVAGDPVYNLLTRQEGYQTQPQMGQVIPFTAAFINSGDRGGWGTILLPLTSITDSLTTGSIDAGAATTNGGAAFLHVLQAAPTDTYTLTLEHAPDNATWTTVGTFTLDGSQVTSERLALSSTLSRYLRLRATRSGSAGDTVRLMVSAVRF